MHFDRYTIALLIKRDDAPQLDEEAAAALQDAHMSHLADLHEAGHLLAAGPLFDERYRGLSILAVEPDMARELKERDPAVQAGLYRIEAIPWMVPGGAMSFQPARFPRSIAEASAD
ncbi:MAG: YciI family protein [Gaiellaceae bacterium]